MGAQRLVHHRERVRRQLVLAGRGSQQHVITSPQPAPAPQRGRDHQVRLGRHGDHSSRVATRDHHARGRGEGQPVPCPPAQHTGHGPVSDPARLVDPAGPVHHVTGTAGTSGTAAIGRRRAVVGLPCSRVPGRARGGIRGAMSGAVMAASAGRSQGGLASGREAAGLRVQAVSGLREISPVCVSEGALEHAQRGNRPRLGIFTLGQDTGLPTYSELSRRHVFPATARPTADTRRRSHPR